MAAARVHIRTGRAAGLSIVNGEEMTGTDPLQPINAPGANQSPWAWCGKEYFGRNVNEFFLFSLTLICFPQLYIGISEYDTCDGIPGMSAFCVVISVAIIVSGFIQFCFKTARPENKGRARSLEAHG